MFTNTTSHPRDVIDCLRQVVHGVEYRVEIAPRDEIVGGKKKRELSMTRKAVKAREKRRLQREAKERAANPEKFELEEAARTLREEQETEEREEEERLKEQVKKVKPLIEIPQMTKELFANLENTQQSQQEPVINFEETFTDILKRFQQVTFQHDPDFDTTPPKIEIDPNASQLSVSQKETYFNGILENYQALYNRVIAVTDDAAKLARSESGAYVSAQEKILLMNKLLFDSENLMVLCKEKMKSFEHPPVLLPSKNEIVSFLGSEDYGTSDPWIPFVKRLPSIPPDPVIFEDPSRQNIPMVPPDFEAEGSSHLLASNLPSDFPPELSFRALSCYSLIRTLSLRLHISPFTPCAFLRSLCLPFPTRLLGEIHVSILRYLFANIGLGKYYKMGNTGSVQLKARANDNVKLDLMARGGDNLSYMDALSWPLFFEDYAFITAERLILAKEGDEKSDNEEEVEPKKTPKKTKRNLDIDPASDSSTSFLGDDAEMDKPVKKSTTLTPSYTSTSTPTPTRGGRTKKRVKRGPSGRFEPGPDGVIIQVRTPVKKAPVVTSTIGKRRGRPPKGVLLIEGEFIQQSAKSTSLMNVVPMKDIIDNVVLFENYPHFNIIKKLRQGHSYHKLAIKQKLDVLEFLLDELIQIDLFISELNFRFNKTQKFPSLFGPLPSDDELANLCNVDQCVVCGLEGELICCDGCTNSYHRKCIGLPAEGELPPGKWFCLECKIFDPVKLGPLRSGSKSSLEWHSRLDLANVYKNPSFANAGIQGNYAGVDMYGQPIMNTNRSADEQFLIIHGYIFNKKNGSNDTKDNPPVCISQEELFELIHDLGPEICLKWPWCQIPFNSKQIWKDGSSKKKFLGINRNGMAGSDAKQDEYFGNYFITPVSHNPTVYFNLYKQAPLPGFISTQSAYGYTFPQEDLFNTYATFMMPPDMNSDHSLDKSKYDPLYPFKECLLRLEREMYQACLLHELWGINRELVTDPWSTSVYKCKSLQELAKYAVKLVDAIHSRAFHDEWNLQHGMKATEHRVHRNYEDMAMDWTPAMELKRRRWERTPIVKSVRLMLEEGHLTSTRSKANTSMRKRKNVKAVVHIPKKEKSTAAEEKNEEGETETNGHVEQTTSAVQNKISVSRDDGRRRSGRVQSRNAVHIGIETLVSDVMPYTMSSTHETTSSYLDTYSNKLQTRINLLEKLVSEPYDKEQAWTQCGRKPYPPEGRLSPSVMRYLGRNAGSVYAPHLLYIDRHEVGQPCISHCWREKTLNCTTVEELALQLRVVDSYLNRTAISTCESFARRVTSSKESVLKLVKCIHRDPSTGLLEYYVVQRGKRRGCWFSEENIDLSALIMDRAIRIEAQRTKFFNLISERRISHEMHDKAQVAADSAKKTLKESEQMFTEKAVTAKKAIQLSETVAKDYQHAKSLLEQAKEKADEAKKYADAERAVYEAGLRSEREAAAKAAQAEAKARARAEAAAAAKAKAAADAKAKAKALAKTKAEAAAKAEAAKAKAEAEKRKKMLKERRRKEAMLEQRAREEEERRNEVIVAANREKEHRNMEKNRQEAQEQKHLNDYDEIVHNHSLKTKQLLHESSFLGQATVPSDKMQFARQKTMSELKEVNNMLRSLGMKSYDDPKLISDLASAEQIGMTMFVKEIGTEGQEDEEEEEEIDQDESQYKSLAREQKEAASAQPVSSSSSAARAAAQSVGSSSADPDAVLKAMGQHAMQQQLLNNLNMQRQEEPNSSNVLNYPSGYTDSESIQNALQQNLFAQSDQGAAGANLSQLYAGYNLGNQAFQLPSEQLNELQAQALQGNMVNPAAYQYAGRQLGGADFQLAQSYDPNSAQMLQLQGLDLSQQQLYSQLPNHQQNQLLQQIARQQQNPSGNNRQYKPGGFEFGQF